MKRFWWVVLLPMLAAAAGLATLFHVPVLHAQSGPTVRITAPANGAALNNPVTVSVTTSGASIKAATDNDPNAAHLHYFVDRDPATVLKAGEPIPTGQPDIIHTADTSLELPTLSPGPHTVWVVLAHTDHTPYAPNVQDRVSFTLGSAAPANGASAAPGQLPVTGMGGAAPADPNSLPFLPLAALLGAAALVAAGAAVLRRWPARR